jgi:hypothetical protein
MAEKVGFEPTDLAISGFQDRPDRPLCHFSAVAARAVYACSLDQEDHLTARSTPVSSPFARGNRGPEAEPPQRLRGAEHCPGGHCRFWCPCDSAPLTSMWMRSIRSMVLVADLSQGVRLDFDHVIEMDPGTNLKVLVGREEGTRLVATAP